MNEKQILELIKTRLSISFDHEADHRDHIKLTISLKFDDSIISSQSQTLFLGK